jgi:hypothetical protein
MASTPQRHCIECNAKVISRKKRCWDCEAANRQRQQRERKRRQAQEKQEKRT